MSDYGDEQGTAEQLASDTFDPRGFPPDEPLGRNEFDVLYLDATDERSPR